MSETISSHEPYAGKDLGALDFTCTPTMVDHDCEGLAIDHARYRKPIHWEKPVAPAMVVGEMDFGFDGARFDKVPLNFAWVRYVWLGKLVNVRFRTGFVCLSPSSGRAGTTAFSSLLTQSGHSLDLLVQQVGAENDRFPSPTSSARTGPRYVPVPRNRQRRSRPVRPA